MGYDPLNSQSEQYTVPEVVDEVRDRNARIRIQAAIDVGLLKIMEPTRDSEDKAIDESIQLGDIDKISTADLHVLALARDLISSGKKCLIITDDYTVQNVASRFGISYKGLTTHGIRYQFLWRQYCPACGRTYPSNSKMKTCNVCGTILRRKVVKKKRIKES